MQVGITMAWLLNQILYLEKGLYCGRFFGVAMTPLLVIQVDSIELQKLHFFLSKYLNADTCVQYIQQYKKKYTKMKQRA
jgi:hypothetical protein